MDYNSEFQEDFFKKYNLHEITIILLQKGEPVQIPLTGHCMKPLLEENDLITINPIDSTQLRCGDVVIYHINGRLKAHRFLKLKNLNGQKYLITKSDRRANFDRPVPINDFLGRIRRVTKGKKNIDYETRKWRFINFFIAKLSPYIWIIELIMKFFRKQFRRVMGHFTLLFMIAK